MSVEIRLSPRAGPPQRAGPPPVVHSEAVVTPATPKRRPASPIVMPSSFACPPPASDASRVNQVQRGRSACGQTSACGPGAPCAHEFVPSCQRGRSADPPRIQTTLMDVQHAFVLESTRKKSLDKQAYSKLAWSAAHDNMRDPLCPHQSSKSECQESATTATPDTPSKSECREPCEDLNGCQDDALPSQNDASEHVPVAVFETELNELKSILDTMQVDCSAGNEQCAKMQEQLVYKAASVATDDQLRGFCAMIACQQARQEIVIRMLGSSVDKLNQQVQRVCSSKLDAHKKDQATCGESKCEKDLQVASDPVMLDKSAVSEKQVSENGDDAKSQQPAVLDSGTANFFLNAVKDTIGEEFQRHEQAIRSLETNMEDIHQFTEKGLKALKQLLNEVLSRTQVSSPDGSPCASEGDSAQQRKASLAQQSSAGEFPRDLHPIAEGKFEADVDGSEKESLVKTLYQDVLNESTKVRLQSTKKDIGMGLILEIPESTMLPENGGA
mmetsp:Transcript_73877/g.135234  ORF Transcript_73877/g.135234 Transcript_73877/m.135234 type:complete len:499 (+) Transcript_73877:108-1604(+)